MTEDGLEAGSPCSCSSTLIITLFWLHQIQKNFPTAPIPELTAIASGAVTHFVACTDYLQIVLNL